MKECSACGVEGALWNPEHQEYWCGACTWIAAAVVELDRLRQENADLKWLITELKKEHHETV